MAQNFLSRDRDQQMLLPADLREWLPDEHLAWFVLDAVEEMNLEPVFAGYRDDGWGRAAHDPEMMVALLLYAYAVEERGIRVLCPPEVPRWASRSPRLRSHAFP